MDGSSLNRLTERTLVNQVNEVAQISNERKGSNQPVDPISLRAFVVETTDTYDWSGKVTGEFFGRAAFDIILTAETAIRPLTDLAVDFYTSTDGVNWNEYTEKDRFNSVAPNLDTTQGRLNPAGSPDKQARWKVAFSCDSGAWIAFKLQVHANDQVTISVTRTE